MKNKGIKVALIAVISLAVIAAAYIFAGDAIKKKKSNQKLVSETNIYGIKNSEEKKIKTPEFDGKTYDVSGLNEKEVLRTDLNNDGVDDIIKIYTQPHDKEYSDFTIQRKTYLVMTNGKDNTVLTSVELATDVYIEYDFSIDAKDVNNDGVKDIGINYIFYVAEGRCCSFLTYKDKTYVEADSSLFKYTEEENDVKYTLLDDFILQGQAKSNPDLKCTYNLNADEKQNHIDGGFYTTSGKMMSKDESTAPIEKYFHYVKFEDVDNDGKYELIHENSVGVEQFFAGYSVCYVRKAYKFEDNKWKMVKISFVDKE